MSKIEDLVDPKCGIFSTGFDQAVLMLANLVISFANRQAIKRYKRQRGRYPNVADPKRYSELLLWRKLVDHNPRFVVFSDKLATKDYYKAVCPDLAYPRVLWVGNDSNDIPDELILDSVYIKANHGWRLNYRVRDRSMDREGLKRKTEKWLKTVHGIRDFQWAYRKIEPKLFVEESIGDGSRELIEFNIRASNGNVILGSVLGGYRTSNSWNCFLDATGAPAAGPNYGEGEPLRGLPAHTDVIEPYLRAVAFTKKLSIGVDYARFDFLLDGEVLYGGEITVYPSGGNSEITNPTVHSVIVDGWDLLASHFLTAEHPGVKRIYARALRRRLQCRRLRTSDR